MIKAIGDGSGGELLIMVEIVGGVISKGGG